MFEGVQIIDRDWRYVYLNEAAARHARRAREELIGRRMEEMYPGIEKTEVFGLLRRCMTERAPQRLVNLFTYPDGRKAWFDLRISPVPRGILILSLDITDQKAIEEALKEAEMRTRALLEAAPDGILVVDSDARILVVNSEAEKMFGYRREELLGQRIERLVPERLLQRHELHSSEYGRDPKRRAMGTGMDIGARRRDGTEFPAEVSLSPVPMPGRIVTIAIVRDITARKEAEAERKNLESQLQQAQKMEAIGRLAGGVAHDFNNLLTAITGYSSLILSRLSGSDPMRGEIEEIYRAGERAAGLTRQLLTLSRKDPAPHPRLLDLNELLSQALKLLRRVIGEDVEVVTDFSQDLGRVTADPGQIEQVVMNLAVNARDAMPDGGRLTLRTENVELDEAYTTRHFEVRHGRYVLLSVSDTGCGMAPDVMRRIFEPFFTTKPVGKGTGLGLSIIYGIVKQLAGHIVPYSEPGKGTIFKVYLPRSDDSPGISDREVCDLEIPTGSESVLVVEDDDVVRQLIVQTLETLGYRVSAAADAVEALKLLRQRKEGSNLLITDMLLPGLGGRELAAEFKQAHSALKVLYISGYPQDHGRGEVNPPAHEPFLQKPFARGELARKVREVLNGPSTS